MALKRTLTVLGLTAMLGLAGCATSTPAQKAAAQAEAQTKAEIQKEVADQLSSTNTSSKSADGEMICKRQSVVGSNFKRKICATADEWAQSERASRDTVADIQRSAGPGVSN